MIATQEQTQEQITAAIVQQTAVATAKAVMEAAQAAAIIVEKDKAASMLSIVQLREKVENIEKQQGKFETQITGKVDKLDCKIDEMSKAIFKKLDELIKGRPSWGVALLIGGLLSLCTGLIVGIVVSSL